MSIAFNKYIPITSVASASATAATRQWCARIYTTNPLVGPNSVLQFTSLSDVGSFFSTASEEYSRAAGYLSYTSPIGTAPVAIQFARYVATDQPATIYGATDTAVLATLETVTAGVLSFKFGGNQVTTGPISFSSATSFSAIAAAIQTAIQATTGTPNDELANATVTWDSSTQAFNFSASPTHVVTETFSVVTPTLTGSQTDLASLLGWYSTQGALVNSASVAEAPVDAFNRVTNLNNNHGSFAFTDASNLTLPEAVAVATANAALNVMFQFHVYVSPANYATWQSALIGIASVALNYESVAELGVNTRQYVEMLPMSVQASIDYTATNSAMGFMYKNNSYFSASVVDDTLSDTLDALRINYIGQTQTAGQKIQFYQRGVLCGGSTAPLDMTVHANEQWFKDAQGAGLMTLQLDLGQIPANKRGQSLCEQQLQSVIDTAVTNGTISSNNISLTAAQQIYITQQTGDSTAYRQVQSLGYWKSTKITSTTASSGVVEYTLKYTIIYRKDDVVKTITGSHQLI